MTPADVVAGQVVLCLFGAAGLVWLGYWLAECRLRRDAGLLGTVRQLVDTEISALFQSQRITDAFLVARDAMRRPVPPPF